MVLRPHLLFASLTVAFAFNTAHSQMREMRGGEIAVGGTGQFTTSITSQYQLEHESTTGSAGFLLTVRAHPIKFFPLEMNYQYSSFSERFQAPNGPAKTFVPVGFHEATAALLFHPHYRKVRPFIGVGGGSLYFDPSVHVHTQLRPAGLLEMGFDIRTPNPHVGFRLQGRSLLYRAPNFNNGSLSSSRWVATEQPSGSVYYRF